jgi:HK97 family phage portal protein
MGFLDRLFGRRRADPAEQIRYVLPYPVSGVQLTPDEAMCLSAVWACIDAIAKAIASCRWNIYQPTGQKPARDPRRRSRVVDAQHAPNPEMTAIAFREAMLYIAIPFGNSYAEIVRDGGGPRRRALAARGRPVTPRRDLESNGRSSTSTASRTAPRDPRAKQVFHLRGPSISGLVGENLVARAAKSLSVAAAQERFARVVLRPRRPPRRRARVPGEARRGAGRG